MIRSSCCRPYRPHDRPAKPSRRARSHSCSYTTLRDTIGTAPMTMLSLWPDGTLDNVRSSVRGGERMPGRAFYRTPFLISALVFLSLLQGCAAPERLAAVPEDQEAAVETVSGMTGVRY